MSISLQLAIWIVAKQRPALGKDFRELPWCGLFKLQLIMFFERIRSERQLIETASLNLARRWYLGYALGEDLPDHSRLTQIRQRLGIEVS